MCYLHSIFRINAAAADDDDDDEDDIKCRERRTIKLNDDSHTHTYFVAACLLSFISSFFYNLRYHEYMSERVSDTHKEIMHDKLKKI